jgi:rhamnose utilization protein RhaD (predicted bifunctional aldolase and dehydrogenase)/NAD(P)-dependent dehydrogenase (short-subunit alcohol dehydrogenase family)
VLSRYNDIEAAQNREDLTRKRAYGRPVSTLLADRTYTSRLLGADPSLVLHGGGNTSAKGFEVDAFGERIAVLYIKGSGSDLATVQPEGLPAVRLEPLKKLRQLDAMSDEQMVSELRLALLEPSAPNPSIETLLHAFLPAAFVEHTHADAVLTLVDQPNAETMCRQIYGKSLVWVPYVKPGFLLAKQTIEAFEEVERAGNQPKVIVLEKHGIFTFGETAKASYEAMIEAVTRAERAIADARRTAAITEPKRVAVAMHALLPHIRGVLARVADDPSERGPILTVRGPDSVLAFLERRDAPDLVSIGSATPDHVIRTKPWPLFIEKPDYSDLPKLAARIEQGVRDYAKRYDAYVDEMCAKTGITVKRLDPWPRLILLPGVGLVAVGRTLRDADAVADVYEHTVNIIADAVDIGRYEPVRLEQLFELEYWSLEQAKIKKTARAPLEGCVAIVTGAASGIGRVTASRLLDLGAHVGLVDISAAPLMTAHDELGKGRRSHLLPFICDVNRPEKIEPVVHALVSAFGGLDLVISNAGTAPEGSLEQSDGARALQRSLETNLLSHNNCVRAAVPIMRAQGRGGCLLFNASKSAFAPGPHFGPYAVAKAGLIALMRQHAIDLAGDGIRSNAVNADRVRTGLFGGGVLESRAAARGLSPDEYFKANLLHREVLAEDVADAFAYLANARSTTGCVVTVDGGNPAAFPR